MNILKYTTVEVPTISSTDLATKARAIIRDYGLRVLPVVENGRLIGIVSRLNILTVTSSKSNLLVRDIMEETKTILKANYSLRKAVEEMLKADIWYAPVVSEDNRFIGLFGLENIIREFYVKNVDVNKLPVKDFMSTNVVTARKGEDVSSILRKMLKHRYSGLPVINDKGKVVGIVTQHDLLKAGAARILLESERSKGHRGVKALDIMNTNVCKVKPDTSLKEVAKLMVKRNIGRIVVVNNKDKLLGIIDREDVVKAYIKYL